MKHYIESPQTGRRFVVDTCCEMHAVSAWWALEIHNLRAIPAESIYLLDPKFVVFEPALRIHYGRAAEAVWWSTGPALGHFDAEDRDLILRWIETYGPQRFNEFMNDFERSKADGSNG